MSTLIDQLKSEHQEIALALTEVKKSGIITNDGHIKLITIKEMILKHLQKENEELYPFLNLHAKNNKILRNNMQVLSVEMKTIIEKLARFYQKYEESGFSPEFNMEFGNLFNLIIQRFSKEEKVLYAEYLKIMNQTKSGVK